MKEYNKLVGEKVAHNLREFGFVDFGGVTYYDVEDNYVQDICEQLVNGTLPKETGGGVIAMFAQDMLQKNGYLQENAS